MDYYPSDEESCYADIQIAITQHDFKGIIAEEILDELSDVFSLEYNYDCTFNSETITVNNFTIEVLEYEPYAILFRVSGNGCNSYLTGFPINS